MKTIKADKKYSWLQWPVVLKSYDLQLHLTIKFFGTAKIDPTVVAESLRRIGLENTPFFNRDKLVWRTTAWASRSGTWIYVLEFIRAPLEIKLAHSEFNLIKDDHPDYRPHLTVPQHFWEAVLRENRTPQSEDIQFGELELCMGAGE